MLKFLLDGSNYREQVYIFHQSWNVTEYNDKWQNEQITKHTLCILNAIYNETVQTTATAYA